MVQEGLGTQCVPMVWGTQPVAVFAILITADGAVGIPIHSIRPTHEI